MQLSSSYYCDCHAQDYYYSQYSEWSDDKVLFIRRQLSTVLNMDLSGDDFSKLEWVALARFIIGTVATWMKEVFIDKHQFARDMQHALVAVQKLCENADLEWPRCVYTSNEFKR